MAPPLRLNAGHCKDCVRMWRDHEHAPAMPRYSSKRSAPPAILRGAIDGSGWRTGAP
jgi:hypothetical protein